MNKGRKFPKMKEIVLLTGYSFNGEVAFEEKIELHEYYDESHHVIDESSFRKERKIRKLIGKIYGTKGELIQEFENIYKENGSYERGMAKHANGTITED